VLRCEGGWYGTAEPKYEAPKNYRFAKRMPNGQLRVVFKGWYPPSCLQRAEVGSVAKATRVQVTKFIFMSVKLREDMAHSFGPYYSNLYAYSYLSIFSSLL
jgi:hypothetical protein